MKKFLKWTSIVLGVVILSLGTLVVLDHNKKMAEFERQRAIAKKKLDHEWWYANLANSTPVRYWQDGKPHVLVNECDMTRPIFIYDFTQNLLMGVIPGKGINFIAERKALPVTQSDRNTY